MPRALSAKCCALLTLTSLARVESQTTSETSATESSTSQSLTTEASTTLPGPFSVMQSVVFLSNGTQEEVKDIVLRSLDLALAEVTRIGLGPVTPRRQVVVYEYEFVHDGHCDGDWIDGNTFQDDVEVCALWCYGTAACGFFAWDTVSTTCAMYSVSGGCPDDNSYASYNAYRLIRTPLVCSDGLTLSPLLPGECPSDADLGRCEDAAPGQLCEADGDECGSSEDWNNCNSYFDVYRKQRVISCMSDAQCPLRYRCDTGSGECEADVSYGNPTARAVTELVRRSADDEAIGTLLAADLPNVTDLFEPRITFGGPASMWQIVVEVTANDLHSSEQVYGAFRRFGGEGAVERADLLDAIQLRAANHSLLFDDFLFSSPLVRGPTQTATTETTATETTTTATTTTQTTTTETTTTEMAAATAETTTTETTTTQTAETTTTETHKPTTATAAAVLPVAPRPVTTTTTAPSTAVAVESAAPAEDITSLVMAVVGGSFALLVVVSGVAVVTRTRRRKAGHVGQHDTEPDGLEGDGPEGDGPAGDGPDVEQATATASSRCSRDTFEV